MVAGATNYGIPRGHRLPCVRGRYSFKVQCRCTAVCCGNSLYTVGKYLNCVSGISTVRKVFILCKVFIRCAAVTLLTHRVTLAIVISLRVKSKKYVFFKSNIQIL